MNIFMYVNHRIKQHSGSEFVLVEAAPQFSYSADAQSNQQHEPH